MCGRILSIILGALFLFIVATIAAFTYLVWWQAFLVSAGTFLLIVRITKWIITRYVGGKLVSMAKGLFDTKGQALRNAEVDVHLVVPAQQPNDFQLYDDDNQPMEPPPNLCWFKVEATIFPDPNHSGPMTHWDVDDLVLVPFHSKISESDTEEEASGEVDDIQFYGVELIENGRAVELDDPKLTGSQRLRFRIAVPPMVHVLKFRYYFEEFGRVELPNRAMLR